MTKVVDDDRARQAKPGRPILYVLVASLLLAGIYLVSMVGWSGVKSPDTTSPQTTQQTTQPTGSGAPADPAGSSNPAPTRQ